MIRRWAGRAARVSLGFTVVSFLERSAGSTGGQVCLPYVFTSFIAHKERIEQKRRETASGPAIADLEAQLVADAVQRAGELHAAAVGRASQLAGYLGPFEVPRAQLGDAAFLVGEPPPHLLEQ